MYYYAYINRSNLVESVHTSETPIVDENYIEITESQYNLPIIMYLYHPETNTFEVWGWSCTTSEVNYPGTRIMATTLLDELADGIDTKADADHTHSEYALASHTHAEYATVTALDELETEVDGKADATHTHSNYASTTHNHDSLYSSVSHNHDSDYSAIGHTHSNYATTTALSNLSDTVSDKADSSHTHDSRYYTETEINSMITELETDISTKASTSHTHTISNITNLQTTLDGKADTSHGTHVNYSTTTPVMDGSATVGTASTVARSDHRHPVDTSRASQSDLDALEVTVSGKANTSHTHTIANVTSLQDTLDSKQDAITGGASTITSSNLITNRALVSNSSGKVAVSAVTPTELGYLDGVTSNVQEQLDGKAASSHTHNYAGSSSVGGAATSANKLNTNAGSSTQPVYFANGVPVACTYTLGKSVPSSAVFTDTNTKVTNTLATTTKAYVTGTTSSATNTGTQVFDTGVYLDTTAGQLTATTFNGTTFSGSGVATVSEVETYLGI